MFLSIRLENSFKKVYYLHCSDSGMGEIPTWRYTPREAWLHDLVRFQRQQ
jgi:hypothetical protein